MADLDWSKCAAVESVPGKVSGAWVFKNTRMPVQTVFVNLEAGMSPEEITEVFDVTQDEVRAVLQFVAESLEKEPSYLSWPMAWLTKARAPAGLSAASRDEAARLRSR